MSTLKKTILLGTTSALALSGMASGIAVAAMPGDDGAAAPTVAEAPDATYYKTDIVTLETVPGAFSFVQNELSPNDTFANMAKAAQFLCGSHAKVAEDDSALAGDWEIAITGKVENPQVMTFEDMASSDAVKKMTMACSCMGNPADGRDAGNAEVTGLPMAVILEEAQVAPEANTIVFTSADGYQVALPLWYVTERYCPLVFDINGAPISEVIGGANQLWLGATSANYFARDVVSITLEERQTPPPAPSSDEAREAYQNLPNVGVLLGGEVA